MIGVVWQALKTRLFEERLLIRFIHISAVSLAGCLVISSPTSQLEVVCTGVPGLGPKWYLGRGVTVTKYVPRGRSEIGSP